MDQVAVTAHVDQPDHQESKEAVEPQDLSVLQVSQESEVMTV